MLFTVSEVYLNKNFIVKVISLRGEEDEPSGALFVMSPLVLKICKSMCTNYFQFFSVLKNKPYSKLKLLPIIVSWKTEDEKKSPVWEPVIHLPSQSTGWADSGRVLSQKTLERCNRNEVVIIYSPL